MVLPERQITTTEYGQWHKSDKILRAKEVENFSASSALIRNSYQIPMPRFRQINFVQIFWQLLRINANDEAATIGKQKIEDCPKQHFVSLNHWQFINYPGK